ncbi:GTP cyclohydrolase II RibA [Pseudomonas fragi]|uniref:GTP cyclohydrolase II n=1 Tax=Pseudomonas fragi TaxID=296 RepID=A0A267AGA2_PSEFR|nr:GTP cyclohydrolase II RibA [Pseudomonas fragi]PAA11673.1 GTP cyclohydrolase [Pseudomonas fragi]
MKAVKLKTTVEIPIEGIPLPTRFVSFEGVDKEHFALLIGDCHTLPVLTRIHSECLTGDVFGSRRCDCGAQLKEALSHMSERGGGVLIYLRQEGRGIGLYSKFDAYVLQTQGIDTFTANEMLGYADDSREFESAGAMLKALDIRHIDLITNNPAKVLALQGCNITINRTLPSGVFLTVENERYLRSKINKKQHTINLNKNR